MHLRSSTLILLVIYFGLITTSVYALADVVARVSYEGRKDYLINITFSSDHFVEFYTCLCSSNTLTCRAEYSGSSLVASKIYSEGTLEDNLTSCKLYQCKNSGQRSSLNCTRLIQQNNCAQLISPTFINLRNVSSCAATCVGVTWSIRDENLSFYTSKIGVKPCNCCSSPETTLVPEKQSPAEFNESKLRPDSEENFENVYIVCGIAGGVILIAVIVFVIVLKMPTGSASFDRRHNRPTEDTDGINHVKNVSKDANTKQDQTNQTQGFGFLKTFKKSNQLNTNEEHGRNTNISIANSKNKNTGKSGKLFSVEVASKFDKNSKENNVMNKNSSNLEDDYAEIDDSQVRISDPYYQNSVPTSEDLSNNEYSPLDNGDYYNIEVVASSLQHSQTELDNSTKVAEGQSKEKSTSTLQDIQNNPVHAQQFPRNSVEYSLAKPIDDETTAENADTPIDKQTKINTPLERSCLDKQDNEEAFRASHFSSGQGQVPDTDTSTGPVGTSKRNTYFELEKELP